MQYEQALVVCAFGWGKEFRLYKETLYVCNKAYRLARLTQVRLTTQHTLGVASACLELRFGSETVRLRGIAAVEDARRAAGYLTAWRDDKRGNTPRQSSTGETSPRKLPQELACIFHEQATHPVDTPPLLLPGGEPRTSPQPGWKLDRRTEHLSRADVLPPISVPVRLESGEQAYYCSRATRCGEPIAETLRSTYPAQDHGLLILTDRRLLFIGRRSQLVLEYAHLLRIARLEGALAFETDHWQKRAIFTMPRPETCASRLEAILQATSRSTPLGISSLQRAAPGRPQGSPPYIQDFRAVALVKRNTFWGEG
jgi:hypothetical protein